jgi:hypothetical protein
MQKIILSGELILDENDLERMNYIVNDAITGKLVSITDILDTINNSTNSIDKLVRIYGRVYDSDETFYGFGKLINDHIDSIKDKCKIKGYYLCNCNFAVERKLYELTEQNNKVEITIEDYSDSISAFIVDDDTGGNLEDNSYDTSKKM